MPASRRSQWALCTRSAKKKKGPSLISRINEKLSGTSRRIPTAQLLVTSKVVMYLNKTLLLLSILYWAHTKVTLVVTAQQLQTNSYIPVHLRPDYIENPPFNNISRFHSPHLCKISDRASYHRAKAKHVDFICTNDMKRRRIKLMLIRHAAAGCTTYQV